MKLLSTFSYLLGSLPNGNSEYDSKFETLPNPTSPSTSSPSSNPISLSSLIKIFTQELHVDVDNQLLFMSYVLIASVLTNVIFWTFYIRFHHTYIPKEIFRNEKSVLSINSAPPSTKVFLSVFAATGAQLMQMTACAIVFSIFGYFSSTSKAVFSTSLFFWTALFSVATGALTYNFYKSFEGKSFNLFLLLTPILVTSILVTSSTLASILFALAGYSSTYHIDKITIVTKLWLILTIPLSLLGTLMAVVRR